jgi:hypothetical protein
MAECKTKLFDLGVVKEWIGTSGKFIKVSVKPGCPGAPKDDKESLTKWLVFQFHVMVIACIVNMAYAAMLGAIATAVTNVITGILSAWISAWFTWFAFAEREPSCCCFGIGHVEGWKHMHLVWGILMILSAVSNVLNYLQAFLLVLDVGLQTMSVDFIIYAVAMVIYCIYGVAMLGVGIVLVKMGGKKSGVDIPAAEVGKESA